MDERGDRLVGAFLDERTHRQQPLLQRLEVFLEMMTFHVFTNLSASGPLPSRRVLPRPRHQPNLPVM
jgi:hypothetical protein